MRKNLCRASPEHAMEVLDVAGRPYIVFVVEDSGVSVATNMDGEGFRRTLEKALEYEARQEASSGD